MAEIDADLDRDVPMQRLLQGDVGSGKTVVALHALLRAVEAGRQGALMAPTETLAEQHFLTIDELCTPLGVRVTLLTSSLRAKEHAAARQLIASGDAQIVVGHARAHREGGRLLRSRGRRRRRAAPLRGRTADRARRGPQPARSPPDRDADPADARAHGVRRPRGLRARAAAGRPQADRHRVGRRGPQLGGVLAAVPAPRRRAPGLRRLPADRGVRDARRACGRGGGRAAAHGGASRLPGRLPARTPAPGRAPERDGELQGARARRPRRDDRDRGRRRRPERDDHDRAGGRPLRPRPAPPAPRSGGARRGAVVLPARLAGEARSSPRRPTERLEAMVATTDGFELAERDLEIRGEGQLLGARQSGYSDLRFVRLRRDQALLERARDAARVARRTRASSPTPSTASSARPSTSATREDRRRLAEGPPDRRRRRASSRGRPAIACARRCSRSSARSRARACSTSSRARARWGSRRSPAAQRAASSSSAIARLRASSRRTSRSSGSRAPSSSRRDVAARAARGARRADAATTSSSSTRRTRSGSATRRSSPSCFPVVLADDGLVVVETSERVEPELPLDLVTTRRYGSARITVFSR